MQSASVPINQLVFDQIAQYTPCQQPTFNGHQRHSTHLLPNGLRQQKISFLARITSIFSSFMRLAIVILNWNGKALLERFLPSVVAHADEAELWVIVNASTDNSMKFLEQNFPSVNRIVLNQNYGFAKGYNEGLKKVDADLFCLLNNDVAPNKNWISPIKKVFQTSETTIAQPKILSLKHSNTFDYAEAAFGFIDRYGYPYCRGRIFEHLEEDQNQYTSSSCFWASGACLFIRSTV